MVTRVIQPITITFFPTQHQTYTFLSLYSTHFLKTMKLLEACLSCSKTTISTQWQTYTFFTLFFFNLLPAMEVIVIMSVTWLNYRTHLILGGLHFLRVHSCTEERCLPRVYLPIDYFQFIQLLYLVNYRLSTVHHQDWGIPARAAYSPCRCSCKEESIDKMTINYRTSFATRRRRGTREGGGTVSRQRRDQALACWWMGQGRVEWSFWRRQGRGGGRGRGTGVTGKEEMAKHAWRTIDNGNLFLLHSHSSIPERDERGIQCFFFHLSLSVASLTSQWSHYHIHPCIQPTLVPIFPLYTGQLTSWNGHTFVGGKARQIVRRKVGRWKILY